MARAKDLAEQARLPRNHYLRNAKFWASEDDTYQKSMFSEGSNSGSDALTGPVVSIYTEPNVKVSRYYLLNGEIVEGLLRTWGETLRLVSLPDN